MTKSAFETDVLEMPEKKGAINFEPLPFIEYSPKGPKELPEDIARMINQEENQEKAEFSPVKEMTKSYMAKGGYSNAVVFRTPEVRIVGAQIGFGTTYTLREQKAFYYKNNNDDVLNNIEKKIYAARKKDGFAAPRIWTSEEAKQIVEQDKNPCAEAIGKLNGLFIEDMNTDLYKYVADFVQNKTDGLINIYKLMKNLAVKTAEDSVYLEKILTEEDLEYVKTKQIDSISQKTKVDENIVRENYFLFRMLECIPGATQKMQDVLMPVADKMKKAMKYKAINSDASERNIFIRDNGEIVRTDFNSNYWMPAVYSFMKVLNSPLPYAYDSSVLTRINEITAKETGVPASASMLVDNLKKLYEDKFSKSGETIEKFISAQKGTPEACSLYMAIRHTYHNLGELAESPAAVYAEDFEKAVKVLHWYTVMMDSARKQGDEFFEDFSREIAPNFNKNIFDICSEITNEYKRFFGPSAKIPKTINILMDEVRH